MQNVDSFVDAIERVLVSTMSNFPPKTKIVLTGDINIHFQTSNIQQQQLANMVLTFGLRPIFTDPTRISKTSRTCIDNVFTDISALVSKIIDSNYGDHKALVIQVLTETTEGQIYMSL